jgi:hypothetical protein
MESHNPIVMEQSDEPEGSEYLYDATLIQLDTLRGSLIFKVNDATHRVIYPHVSSFSVGAVGRLRLPSDHQEFSFNVYPDQRLRRAPSLDQPQERRWGWKIGERSFTVEVGVIPGRAGKVIRRDTQPLTLEVPREFVRFCTSRGIAPDRVVTRFIADLCRLTNFFGCPREDGYTSSGGMDVAGDYFNQSWGDTDPARPRAPRTIGPRRSREGG